MTVGPIEIAAACRCRRQELGLTLQQVAAMTGQSRSRIADWEARRKCPSLRLLTRWCAVLGVQISIAFGQAETPPPKLKRGGKRLPRQEREILPGLDRGLKWASVLRGQRFDTRPQA